MWDYPRPPRVEPTPRRIRAVLGAVTLIDSTRAVRVLETSHPPSYYVPLEDVNMDYFVASLRRSHCEFKGMAHYWDLQPPEGLTGRPRTNAAWGYAQPTPGFEVLKGRMCLYAWAVDRAMVDDERVVAQDGDFYGGWRTSDIVGPFKGGPGTWGW